MGCAAPFEESWNKPSGLPAEALGTEAFETFVLRPTTEGRLLVFFSAMPSGYPLADNLNAAHVGNQNIGHLDGAVCLLVVLDNGSHGAANRQARAVERVHKARTLEVFRVCDT